MLFRTVYGPELEAIYHFVATATMPPSRQLIQAAFLPQCFDDQRLSTQSVDDALSFLVSARLIEEKNSLYISSSIVEAPFRVKTLHHLRALELGLREAGHPIDPLYTLLLTELFIGPNQLFIADVHKEANKLRQVTEAGGLSQEKIQAWKRVMEFLGIGRRMFGGFQCAFGPDLLLEILNQHGGQVEVLQTFLEAHLGRLLPYQTERGDLALAVQKPLHYLEQTGQIILSALQDSPRKPYFGDRKIKQITRLEVTYVS